jgi:SAM-dependent methyltransferase
MVSDALPTSYFDRMYEQSDDPWDFAGRWYERRKRALLLASLPMPRFRRAFEPGCSTGLLTAELATRCDSLLATDVADRAVATTAGRLARFPGVDVERLRVPEDWPPGRFDLVVLSELAYYLDEAGAYALGAAAAGSLTADGVLVVCHWRHPVHDYPLSGDRAQALVRNGSGLATQVTHREDDFILEVLVPHGYASVAAAEGLLGP